MFNCHPYNIMAMGVWRKPAERHHQNIPERKKKKKNIPERSRMMHIVAIARLRKKELCFIFD